MVNAILVFIFFKSMSQKIRITKASFQVLLSTLFRVIVHSPSPFLWPNVEALESFVDIDEANRFTPPISTKDESNHFVNIVEIRTSNERETFNRKFA
jgi:hypothetical protein